MAVAATLIGRDRTRPRGRPVDDDALTAVRALVGRAPPARDRLIECLHLIQDRFGHLTHAHLRALAAHMRLSQAEVFEVATFYHHFDVVGEGERAPAPLTVRVCTSISCALAGGEALARDVRAVVDPGAVRVIEAPCMGRCADAPAVRIGDNECDGASLASVTDAIRRGDIAARRPPAIRLAAYRAAGGYRTLEQVRSGALAPDTLLTVLEAAGLRGLGGAGFPLARKWGIVAHGPAPRLMTINADEGEPGTFKDRGHLENDPHRMLEGALIAAHVVDVARIYLYVRDEYPAAIEILREEIAALEATGLVAPGFIEFRRGAGAYICGEESAMLQSIEGKRGYPRHRPPYIAAVGLFGRPTLNHNVETLWWVRDILENGAEWFAEKGRPGHKGVRSYSVSGRVANPGVKVAPAGISARDLIHDHCGGMAEGHTLKAYLPGGASGGLLPASLADLPLDFGGPLAEAGAFVGSHAVVVFSQVDNMRDVALNLSHFFREESCGQCTPCREGTAAMVRLLERTPLDEAAIAELSDVMADASICGLGQAAPNPVRHLLEHFREDLC